MAVGLPPIVLVKILSPAFFARGDTKTPLKIAVLSMATNVALAFALMGSLGTSGIALAAALAAWVNAGVMGFILRRRDHLPLDRQFRRRVPRLMLASILMGVGLFAGTQGLGATSDWSLALRIATLGGLVAGGGIVYFGLAQMLGGANLREVRQMLTRRKSTPVNLE